MDHIFLQEMVFYGYHGVFEEENKLGQRFIVDILIDIDLWAAGQTDDLKETINYQEVYDLCQKIVEGPPFKLVESVAEKIASELLHHFPLINQCQIKVTKPDPPIPGHYKSVGIEITRGR